ncbi:hypothetical protein BDP27DRAFT_1338187 [Rhodocollybia butyracea]|uniref:Uncharacterized protein n=1 Tax=Rhodocollybia butyracea TaxID=206335 RepID=A0A9P5PCN8_9AGAR|nr:hypothetical protein BDP27DRAFT_1338187 [Rhodocollybia butyracea]
MNNLCVCSIYAKEAVSTMKMWLVGESGKPPHALAFTGNGLSPCQVPQLLNERFGPPSHPETSFTLY